MNALLERATGFRWLDPSLLLLALLVPAALLLRRRRGRAAVRFGPAALLRDDAVPPTTDRAAPPIPGTWRTRLVWLPRALEVAGVLLAVAALARPVRRELEPLETEGVDLLLALDRSSSMTVADMDRTRDRLAVARDAAIEFVRRRPRDRIGLVTFARYVDLACPPTLDHAALERLVRDVATVRGDGPEDATAIGAAVARAADVLSASPSRSKVVILLTDGEENVAVAGAKGEIAPSEAAQLCARLGVRVYAVVVGAGAVGRGPGAQAASPIDTTPVRRLAARTGGEFFEAKDARAASEVYGRIDALETSVFREPRYATEDAFLPVLALALALLLAGRLLGAGPLAVLP